MKLKTLILAVSIVASFFSCKKEVIEPKINANQPSVEVKLNKIDVVDGRLRFTGEAFREAIEADRVKTDQIIKKLQSHTSFSSINKIKNSANATNSGHSKTAGSCNCDVDDDFANEIVDEFYMVDIDEWTVKIDGCLEKFYILDRVGLNPDQLEANLNDMRNCKYSEENKHLYGFSFDYELLDALEATRDEIDNGVFELAFGCGDDACSDREDVSWEYENDNVLFDTPSPHTLDVKVPRVYLRYEKKILKGVITLWIQSNEISASNPMRWNDVHYEDCIYRERCGNTHTKALFTVETIDPFSLSVVSEGPRTYYVREEYYGKRLKAGFGNYKLRVMANPDAFCDDIDTDWVEIVF
jgi:hypothetical protein